MSRRHASSSASAQPAPTERRRPPRGGQQGFEPLAVRVPRDQRIWELTAERWSQREIAAEVGLTQGGVCKAIARIARRHLQHALPNADGYRMRFVAAAERRARAAREGFRQSQAEQTRKRQTRTSAAASGGPGGEHLTSELISETSPGDPRFLAEERREDMLMAKLLGVAEPMVVRSEVTLPVTDEELVHEVTTLLGSARTVPEEPPS